MRFKIYYRQAEWEDEDSEHMWRYKSEDSSVTNGIKEAMDAFFKWAIKEKSGCLPFMIILEDYI